MQDECKRHVLDFIRAVGRQVSKDTIERVMRLYHPECSRRDIQIALVHLELEGAIRAVYSTEFVAC